MTKAAIWWNTVNSIFLFVFWFVFLFTYGNLPSITSRIDTVEKKVESIDYHLQCRNQCDTIVINNYFQQKK